MQQQSRDSECLQLTRLDNQLPGGRGGGGGGGGKGARTTDSYTMIFYSDIFNKFKPSSKNVQDHQVDSLETSMHLEYRFLDKDQGSYH
jgi:hypothetical protein